MKRLMFLLLFSITSLLLTCSMDSVNPSSAHDSSEEVAVFWNRSVENHPAYFKLPPQAILVLENVYHLGKKGEYSGYAIIHKKKGYGKPEGTPGKGGGKDDSGDGSDCYEFLSKGAKWKIAEDYVINPKNRDFISEDTILAVFQMSIAKWENAANYSIIGNGAITEEPLSADVNEPDDLNEVYFADIDEPGVIGVTIIWGIFGGPPRNRELVAWDQVYDDVDFRWATDGDSDKMDLENIVIHELGHTVGLGDIYTESCNEQTMYGYAIEGEIKKRTLEAGDITGISELY